MTSTRRLATILAADAVGYSRLRGQDEAGTAKAVGRGAMLPSRSWTRPAAASSRRPATACWLEFPSIVAVVECATAPSFVQAKRPRPQAGKCQMI